MGLIMPIFSQPKVEIRLRWDRLPRGVRDEDEVGPLAVGGLNQGDAAVPVVRQDVLALGLGLGDVDLLAVWVEDVVPSASSRRACRRTR